MKAMTSPSTILKAGWGRPFRASTAGFAILALQAGIAIAPVATHAQDTGPRPTIAILDFNNGSIVNHADYDALSAGLSDILLTELGRNPRIVLVERSRLRAILDEQDLRKAGRVDAGTAARVGKVLGAQYVITGGFLIDRRETIRISVRAVNVETSVIAHVESVTGAANDLLDATGRLAERLNAGLRLPAYARGRGRDAVGAASSSPGTAAGAPDLRTILGYSRALFEEDRGNVVEARRLYQLFVEQTPEGVAAEQRERAQQRIAAPLRLRQAGRTRPEPAPSRRRTSVTPETICVDENGYVGLVACA